MKILPIVSYQTRENKTNQSVSFSGIRNAKKASLLATAILGALAGCTSTNTNLIRPADKAATKVAKAYKDLNSAEKAIRETESAINWLMSAGYMYKKPQYEPITFRKYLLLDPNNPMTSKYRYKDIAKIFGVPEDFLMKSNNLNPKKSGLALDEDQFNDQLKIFTYKLSPEVRKWLEEVQFQKKWKK